MEIWLYIIGFFPLIALIGWIADNFHKAKLYSKLKPRLDNLDAKEAGLAVLLTQGEPTQQNDSGESGGGPRTGTPMALQSAVRCQQARPASFQGSHLKRVSGLMLDEVEDSPLRGDFVVGLFEVGRAAQSTPVLDCEPPQFFEEDLSAAVQSSDVLGQGYPQYPSQVVAIRFPAGERKVWSDRQGQLGHLHQIPVQPTHLHVRDVIQKRPDRILLPVGPFPIHQALVEVLHETQRVAAAHVLQRP